MSNACSGYDLLLRFVFGAFNRKYLMVLFPDARPALSCDSFVHVLVCGSVLVCACGVSVCLVFSGIFIS